MNSDRVMLSCDVCGKSFQFGPHRYDGKAIPAYGITVCTSCWNANWDGWAPHLEGKVTAKVVAEGKSLPPRNTKGLFPRE